MRTAFLVALASMALRVVLLGVGRAPDPPFYMPVHLLALVLIPFLAARSVLHDEPRSGVPQLFRAGFRAAALYTLSIAAFLLAYYTWMDVTSFPVHINALVDQAVAAGHDEADARSRFERFFTPFNYASLSFFLLLLLGAFNTLLTTLLVHKVLRRMI
ncbi:MAG TPA: hypothetical protein PKE21_00170 [Flavobacteriales bacterium]|nr:hypothetical protein [Flavobacteriales bacterium]HMR25867.1 hypothetical protein [Flavobacteriales bacterium]